MYEKFKDCEIEIFCNDSRQQILYLQTPNNKDKTYFINKFINFCKESVLILSNNNSFDDFLYPDWKRDIVVSGLPNLSFYNGGVENFLSIYDQKPFQRYINIETLSDDDLLRLLSKIHVQGKQGNSISLIIDDLTSILNRPGFKNDPYTNKNLANTFSYNSTLVCDGIPIGKELYSWITHITTIVQHRHEQLYDVIYEGNSETLENRTLDGIKFILRQ